MSKLKMKDIELALGITAKVRREKMMDAPKCKVCNKTPYEIKEYLYNTEKMDPVEFVVEHERFVTNNKFYCTDCYIKVGMPLF